MIKIFITIFLYGLLLQFFLYNWITFWFQRNDSLMRVFRLRKEFLIAFFCLVIIWKPGIKRIYQLFLQINWFKRGIILFVATFLRSAITHLIILDQSFSTFFLGIKYDFIGFLLVFLWYLLWWTLEKTSIQNIVLNYIRVLKYILLAALLWYVVILIKPWTLKLFGYNNYIYEWQAWGEAPAVYYTHINQWIPRNQFLFERPTTRWFFLVAFWPLFYMRYLFGNWINVTRWWWLIYGLNIILTFSRAARGSWIIEILLLWIVTHRQSLKTYLKNILLPLILIVLFIWWIWFKQIMARWYSNRWHVTMIQKWVSLFLQHPWIGIWLASVWPWSHREWWLAFNPENQFLQILIELWILGFTWWMLMYVWMNWIGLDAYIRNSTTLSKTNNHISLDFLLALSIGLIWLSISWIVLHSFVDRMVVYPFCFLFGVILLRHQNDLQEYLKTI